MGGAGGILGGAGMVIEADISLTINGSITANGTSSNDGQTAGGAGGGIIVRSPKIFLNGRLSANGGDGNYCGGGGGGGRIKVFYNDNLTSLSSHASVLGGKAGGYRNTRSGEAGTIYQDYIPLVKSIIDPPPDAKTTSGIFPFRFTVEDLSYVQDYRTETICPTIELSEDGFKTIAYSFDQNSSLAGWNRPLYYSGDTVEYIPQASIKNGLYSWRIKVADSSLSSRYTEPKLLTIGASTAEPTVNLSLLMTPTVIIEGDSGKYQIDWTSSLEQPNWNNLVTIIITNSPVHYFDLSGIGQPMRFYRAQFVP
jgi:hypothetical protein